MHAFIPYKGPLEMKKSRQEISQESSKGSSIHAPNVQPTGILR